MGTPEVPGSKIAVGADQCVTRASLRAVLIAGRLSILALNASYFLNQIVFMVSLPADECHAARGLPRSLSTKFIHVQGLGTCRRKQFARRHFNRDGRLADVRPVNIQAAPGTAGFPAPGHGNGIDMAGNGRPRQCRTRRHCQRAACSNCSVSPNCHRRRISMTSYLCRSSAGKGL